MPKKEEKHANEEKPRKPSKAGGSKDRSNGQSLHHASDTPSERTSGKAQARAPSKARKRDSESDPESASDSGSNNETDGETSASDEDESSIGSGGSQEKAQEKEGQKSKSARRNDKDGSSTDVSDDDSSATHSGSRRHSEKGRDKAKKSARTDDKKSKGHGSSESGSEGEGDSGENGEKEKKRGKKGKSGKSGKKDASKKKGKSGKSKRSQEESEESEDSPGKTASIDKKLTINKKEDSHLISEVIRQGASTDLNGHESKEQKKRAVAISIRNDSEAGIVKSISMDLLKKTDSQFGTSLVKKSQGKVLLDLEEIKKTKQTEDSIKNLSRADQILKRLTLDYSRNKEFTEKVESLAKITKKLNVASQQRIFLHVLHNSESPYIILSVLKKFTRGPVFLSDSCAVQMALFVRSLRGIYLDAIPYSKIIREVFESCAMPDVTVEHAYDILSQIEQEDATRSLLIDLFGKMHVVNYYKELCAGVLSRNISRGVLYSVMYTINDKSVAKECMAPMFNRLNEYVADKTVEKNSVVFARAVWALFTAHTDAFDSEFDTIIKYIGYFCDAFTESSCEFLSIDDASEIVDTFDVLANAVVNRTVQGSTSKNKKDSAAIKNYVEKKEVKREEKVRIVPEMENVDDSDSSSESSEESEKHASEETSEGAETAGRLNNVSVTQEKLLVFNTLIAAKYKEVFKKLEGALEWKKRPSYDTLLYVVSHVKLLHLLLYLSRISGSSEIPVEPHGALFRKISTPASFDANKHDGTQDLADRMLSEKWNSLGFLMKEGLISSVSTDFTKDVLKHTSPYQMFHTVSTCVHLLSFPTASVFLENGHIYDFIYLQTLPSYVRHKSFLETLKKTIRAFISKAEKEALVLLVRRLIELDGFYTEREAKKGSKKSSDPNHYAAVKHVVRDTVASLFITEMDLSASGGIESTVDSRSEHTYDTVDVEMNEKKVFNPVTKQEEFRVSEEIVFKRFGTDRHQEKNAAKEYYKKAKEGKNVDQKRRKIVFDFIQMIKDSDLSDKFIKALVKLPSVVTVRDKMLLYIIKVVIYGMEKLSLSDSTLKAVQDFANDEYKENPSDVIKDAAKCLYVKTCASLSDSGAKNPNTYNGLVLSLLILITTNQGNLNALKDGFFRICSDLEEYERNELLLLFRQAGVPTSKSLEGTSEELAKYMAVKGEVVAFPALE
ncbi:uncharacterized protein NEMAJ01_0518 [Nematocida major]|uniref:uncharacterized protein n=1 Tax=Nematocida major TaxID=1912982 RepID=UPI002008A2D9|nr:uncharacterized protein NEMAJ01_0518 [Nematocida major]KAH9385622.1 hypothetical protein NEMAJ01_0518 [Nematocida major]